MAIYPVAATVGTLLAQLGELASQWRSVDDHDQEIQIEVAYANAVEQLYREGWDGNIQIDSLLPLERMPEVYMRRASAPKICHN